MKAKETVRPVCTLCHHPKPASQLVPAELVRGGVADLIRQEHPEWGAPGDTVCLDDLNRYRARYVGALISEERGELTALEKVVVERLQQQEFVATDTNLQFDRALTFGERLSDRVARFGGSWAFILSFTVFLFLWMAVNSFFLLKKPFDPFPFILLNLILSTVAALQAPIIMMSQNRQEAKDRMRAEHDYQVNLKAELEIRLLSERIDTLISHQWQRLLEIQEIQVELMQELNERSKGGSGGKA
ncbi:MAG TPA: DUF1003 domain-containing protein [Thermoanaerobaculia bacterium]|nr:DUF1003 domain-containing protein [Thermoanaerobaculia bacterium]